MRWLEMCGENTAFINIDFFYATKIKYRFKGEVMRYWHANISANIVGAFRARDIGVNCVIITIKTV